MVPGGVDRGGGQWQRELLEVEGSEAIVHGSHLDGTLELRMHETHPQRKLPGAAPARLVGGEVRADRIRLQGQGVIE